MKTALKSDRTSLKGLQLAEQIAIVSAEYSTTGTIKEKNKKRSTLSEPTKSCKPYKAVVHVLLKGGMDSFNLLVPHSLCAQKGKH
jgi:hypothetical protein